ncbi:protein of unknown function DUF465 [Methylobacterium sp. 4-46]|uniref:YdcH family protein n=1 Tax=unclassified Methylobacterium TaxID=2615210 RepID=UPI000165CDA0|nr:MULTISPECIES: YdcH family protein [Methylobacterium]ACA20408.1 protein of unknown function DUF465 [Methylobacterium sp. 4-46]WFT79576.1 YdcH family protein [Methylobacterium nodulans]
MSHVPHELANEFPDQGGRIQALRQADGRFAALVERYHTINRAVHRMEARIEPVSDETERAARLERLRLKDEIARWLDAAPRGRQGAELAGH